MKTDEHQDQWPTLDEDAPSPDLSRDDAAFERELPRLLREHPGKVALFHGDELVGVFDDANQAVIEGCRRFGLARLVCYPITEPEGPAYVPNGNTDHPSFERADG
jgi:hypothetical protein